MIKLNLKKSAHIVLFDGVILSVACLFIDSDFRSLIFGSVVSVAGLSLCLWAKRYKFSKKNFIVDGPYLFVRYPYLLGHFIFVFGMILVVRNFVFLVVTICLLAYVYSRVIKYAERSQYSNADAEYIYYRSSVPALIPQLVPYQKIQTSSYRQSKINFWRIATDDNYTELFRFFCTVVVCFFAVMQVYYRQVWAFKGLAFAIVAAVYVYKIVKTEVEI
ncbi:hypothetical protein N9D31_01825 [Oligoflexaceae bacterium]|nr:hypothetical protein [Oligoflexaceae bacterium]